MGCKGRKKTVDISRFDLRKTVDEQDGGGDDVTITGDGSTELFITKHNVDPTKVIRYMYENFKTFISNLVTVLLDCHVMGRVTELAFWQELVPPLYKGVLIQAQISTKLVGCLMM
ncbi:hypothetical protein Tco_1222176 [Tanacetum coccineum]